MQNLLSNALKFRREDVVPEIAIDASVAGETATIVVRDNGIGFEPQYNRRIFRVFERLHGRGTYPGTGIGLALCRKIAERHGGAIVADSVPGAGSTFTVTLPVAARRRRDRRPPRSEDDDRTTSRREEAPCPCLRAAAKPVTILLADDDEEDRELTRDALRHAHLANDIQFVVDGQDLMDYLRREGAYADPGDRRAAARASSCWTSTCPRRTGARRSPRSRPTTALRRIPVVVLTTSKDEEDVFATYDLGVSGFVTKPVTFAGPRRGDAHVDALLVRGRRTAQRRGRRWPRAMSR